MWFSDPPDCRILSWRNWRQSLQGKTTPEILKQVVVDWSRVPTVNHYLVPDQIEEWPTAWQLIYENIYCDLAISLGMFYSLALLEDPVFDNLELRIYQTNHGWLNLSFVDSGKYVLNYNLGEIVNIQQLPNDIRLTFCYSKVDLLNHFN